MLLNAGDAVVVDLRCLVEVPVDVHRDCERNLYECVMG